MEKRFGFLCFRLGVYVLREGEQRHESVEDMLFFPSDCTVSSKNWAFAGAISTKY
jgi:hypothetical protein